MLKNRHEFIAKLHTIIPENRVLIDEPMSKHTTFKIGGPADYFVSPASPQEIAAVVNAARAEYVPITILGNGSNVLVRDKGIRGLVIKISRDMGYVRHVENIVVAGAGALLAGVARHAADFGLSGMEFAIGIPGSIGGAVYMNAGAYDGEMKQVVSAVDAVWPDGTIQKFLLKDLEFNYRHSVFQKSDCIICEVELTLRLGNRNAIEDKMKDYTSRRITKQPVELPSAGSTFKRPNGYFAGTLIEQTGLKGLTIGGAQVSQKHAGFIVNAGGATAGDVLNLIAEVQKRVADRFGVHLHPEVKILGEE